MQTWLILTLIATSSLIFPNLGCAITHSQPFGEVACISNTARHDLHVFLTCAGHALARERNGLALLVVSEVTYSSITDYRNNFVMTSRGNLWSTDGTWSMFSVLRILDQDRFMNNFQKSGSLRKSPLSYKDCMMLLASPKASASLPSAESLDPTPNGQGQRTQAPAPQQIHSHSPSFPDTNFHENQTQHRKQGQGIPKSLQICSLISLDSLACFFQPLWVSTAGETSLTLAF